MGESGRKEQIARFQDHIRSIRQVQHTVGENSSSCCVGQGSSNSHFRGSEREITVCQRLHDMGHMTGDR